MGYKYFRLGVFYEYDFEDVNEALKAYKKASSYDPEEEIYARRIIDILIELHEFKKALNLYKKLEKNMN